MRYKAWHIVFRLVDKHTFTLLFFIGFGYEEGEFIAILVTHPYIQISLTFAPDYR